MACAIVCVALEKQEAAYVSGVITRDVYLKFVVELGLVENRHWGEDLWMGASQSLC